MPMQPIILTVLFAGVAVLVIKEIGELVRSLADPRIGFWQLLWILAGALGALSFLVFGTIAIVLMFGGGS